LYDNSAIADDETEEVSLIKLTENMIMQYGVQVILLDNLMTAIGLESVSGSDKYEKQSEFMKDLSKMALRHNALILLVAHKRKNNFSTNEDDETSGSSDIPNLATITMSYNRDDLIDEDQRRLIVSKNRLFGKVEKKGFIVNYDKKSKRIYGYGDDVNVDYGWNSDSDGFIPLAVDSPFG
jgi:RecA-family ATPase